MYRRRYRRYYTPAAPKKQIIRTEDEWSVKQDGKGRKRYYKNGSFMAACNVPSDICEKLKTEPIVKCPVVKNYLYFDALPMDLRKFLMLYFSVQNIKKLCDISTFAPIYNNDDFWYKLFVDQFTSKHKINTKSPMFRSWRQIYLYFINYFNKPLSKENLILRGLNANGNCMDRKIAVLIKDINDVYFIYYIIIKLIETGDHTFPVVKSIIEEKHLDWPSIYQYGREHHRKSWNLPYDISYFSNKAIPITGKSLEQLQYFLKFLPAEHPYFKKLLNIIFKKCLENNNIAALEYLLSNYSVKLFNLNSHLIYLYKLPKFNRIELMRFLVEKGAQPFANNELLLTKAIADNDIAVLRFLIKQGLDVRFKNDEALSIAVRNRSTTILKYLISKKLDVNTQNNRIIKEIFNDIPEQLLYSYDHIIRLLLEHGANTDELTATQLNYVRNLKNTS